MKKLSCGCIEHGDLYPGLIKRAIVWCKKDRIIFSWQSMTTLVAILALGVSFWGTGTQVFNQTKEYRPYIGIFTETSSTPLISNEISINIDQPQAALQSIFIIKNFGKLPGHFVIESKLPFVKTDLIGDPVFVVGGGAGVLFPGEQRSIEIRVIVKCVNETKDGRTCWLGGSNSDVFDSDEVATLVINYGLLEEKGEKYSTKTILKKINPTGLVENTDVQYGWRTVSAN